MLPSIGKQSRISALTELRLIWLVRTRADIKLHPSGYSFSMLYIASYNKLEQLHMQKLLNNHLAAF